MPGLPQPPRDIGRRLRAGAVIPAHPLALTRGGRFDERRQRALTRYYLASGAGGIAVAVHTTQFGIRAPGVGLLRPVLALAAEAADEAGRPVIRVSGICGATRQAVREAELARELGYHVGLVSLGALPRASDARLLQHMRAVADVLPVMGFYLQESVGGRPLGYGFWRALAELENLVAIKIAPFDRYRTLDVVRAVSDAGRTREVALYTGNDDHIVLDLLARYRLRPGRPAVRMVGGLLGQWAVGTRRAVGLWQACRRAGRGPVPRRLLDAADQLTDLNAALFDPEHGFAGCIPGIHEVLRRHGLLANRRCLDPTERLSPGQAERITRALSRYPHLLDEAFIAERLDDWLR